MRPVRTHQPITRPALAEPGDRLVANGFCTVCGVRMEAVSPKRSAAHLRNHVNRGEAVEIPDLGGSLTELGASEARKRAEYERTGQS